MVWEVQESDGRAWGVWARPYQVLAMRLLHKCPLRPERAGAGPPQPRSGWLSHRRGCGRPAARPCGCAHLRTLQMYGRD